MKQESYGQQTKNSTERMGGGGVNKNTVNTVVNPKPGIDPMYRKGAMDQKHNNMMDDNNPPMKDRDDD